MMNELFLASADAMTTENYDQHLADMRQSLETKEEDERREIFGQDIIQLTMEIDGLNADIKELAEKVVREMEESYPEPIAKLVKKTNNLTDEAILNVGKNLGWKENRYQEIFWKLTKLSDLTNFSSEILQSTAKKLRFARDAQLMLQAKMVKAVEKWQGPTA